MENTVKGAILVGVMLGSYAIWYLTGSYAVELFWPVNPLEGASHMAVAGSVGAIFAAAFASPFLVILFKRHRWLAAVFVVAPTVAGAGHVTVLLAYWAIVYFLLLLAGVWLFSRVLTTKV